MPYTQADIDALRARIQAFAGVKNTQFSDQSTTFDLDDALKLLALMEREVNACGGRSRTRYGAFSKGVQ